MRHPTRLLTARTSLVLLLAAAGCSARLKDEDTCQLKPGTNERFRYKTPLIEKGTVTVSSPGVSINVHVVLEDDLKKAQDAIDSNKSPKDVLAGAEDVKEKTLEFAPGRKPFAIILWGARKDCTVLVKVDGK